MKDNQMVAKYAEHQDLVPDLAHFAQEASAETGFMLDGGEAQRRTLYDPNKVWRVRLTGTFQGLPALLRIENMKLEQDEESIRQAFRTQASEARVRPPMTYLSHPFDRAKGYAFSIDERVEGNILFDSSESAERASRRFCDFYRALRQAVKEPFWPCESGDAKAFSQKQAETWRQVAEKKTPEHTAMIWPFVERLRGAMLAGITDHPLRFQHAHLAGSDIRVMEDGSWVVFANHFWSWRQPGYDVTFPLWHQWMASPIERRTSEEMKKITDTWLNMIGTDLGDLIDMKDVRPMLFNRLYGSLLLDIPAKIHGEGETEESVQRLEEVFKTEAERLMREME